MVQKSDYLVIGCGLAGLAFALRVADHGQVFILSKGEIRDTNTALAQGGVAAAIGNQDDFESHVQDTLRAGAGLCNEDVVRQMVSEGPGSIEKLVEWGVKFDLSDSSTSDTFALTREGGHSHRRILHVEDHTGYEIHRALLARAQQHPNIHIFEKCFAIDLIIDQKISPRRLGSPQCLGSYVFNHSTDKVEIFLAPWTVLATGGVGKVYLYTSNWSGATGDGVAMAYRAGSRVANLEFMQFHPTCLYHPHARNFLISEALRGEGGELINGRGKAFMKNYHSDGNLAPRDIVARSIDQEMKQSGDDCVFLDMSHLDSSYVKRRFPQIYKKCLELEIDITKQPIPVVPAAHYLCGGVWSSPAGETDVAQLLVLGESACTGLHGANRLASNSLLECLAMAHFASQKALATPVSPSSLMPAPWDYHHSDDSDERIVISHMWDEIRRLMWNYVGIVRSNRRLERAQHRLQNLRQEIYEYYWNFKINPDLLELRNIALVADLTVACALKRHESRGIHFSLDFPKIFADDDQVRSTVLRASELT